MASDEFSRFEHEGWQRVAQKYDSVWASSTRQFIPPLLNAAQVHSGMTLLDVGCGPGYVAAAAEAGGARPTGLDFSSEMIAIARKLFPTLDFRIGDAQLLPFADETYERVLTNFALLHVSDPERACVEACRVLKIGGKLAFTVWAPPPENLYAKIIDDALEAYADFNVPVPQGPNHYLYSGKEAFREALIRAGFDGASMLFKLHTIEWAVPSADFVFQAERCAGVRTAGLLAQQTPEALDKIRRAIEAGVQPFAAGDKFVLPKSAYIVAVTKGS